MPFQVIQQTFVDRKEPIFLISVSDNQFFICNFGFVPIALNAVTLGNPSGHTFEWELVQFTGNMLIPNPDMTTGSIFGAGDGVLQVPPYTFNYTMEFGPPGFPSIFSTADMYWEFVIDRGTPEEQRLNTVVFFTPTSQLGTTTLMPPAATVNPLISFSGTDNLNQGRSLLFKDSDRRISNLTSTPANPLTPQCVGGKISDKFLTWTVGSDAPDDFIDLTVFENAAGTFVPVATITDPSIIYYTGTTLGNSYKLRVRMNDGVGASPFITEREIGPILLDTSAVPAAFSPYLTSLITNHDRGNVRVENLNTFLITIKTLLADIGPPVGDVPGQSVSATPSLRQAADIHIQIPNFNVFLITIKAITLDLGPPVADDVGQFVTPTPSIRSPDLHIAVTNYTVVDLTGGGIGGG